MKRDANMMGEGQAEIPGEPGPRDPVRDQAILDALGASLAAKRAKAIDAREAAGIDRRWFDDIEAYEGRDEVTRAYAGLRATVQGYIESQEQQTRKRSTLVVNVTRQKVDACAARRQDIALPTDDRNWDLRPSRVPELVEQMSQKHIGLTKNGAPVIVDDQGQQRQATMADLAKMTQEKANKAAQLMRDEIDDQLDMSDDGCGYEGLIREAIHDEALLGVGIVKGPIITSRTKKVWIPTSDGQKTVHTLSRIQDLKPTSSRVDPWDFYPHQDCGENVKKGAGTWERSRITGADIRHMADLPGYLIPQLQKVLKEGPVKAGEKKADKPGTQTIVDTDTIFEQWEYHGEIDRESIEAAGGTVSDEDIFTSYSGVVIMINDTVVKADIEILDTEELPYDIYVTNKCSGSWAGYGVSFLARSAQKAITASWRMMMDNAGQTVGAQIVVNRGLIVPADGSWQVNGMKLYWAKDKETDVSRAFSLFTIPSNQAEYANIIKMGMEFLDSETAIPMLAQGEQGEATDVLGGMNLLLNASNVVQRRALKCLDDQVTIPHIGRYVDWNMQYNPKSEIKGDFEVQARASGALLEQDIQNKGAANLLAIAANPAYAHGMKKWDALRRVVKALRFDPKEFVKTDDEIKLAEEQLAKNPPSDPRIAVAQLRGEIEQKLEQMRQQFEGQENEKDRQSNAFIAMIDEQIASAELGSAERQVLVNMKTKLADTVMKLQTQKQLSAADIAHDKDVTLAGHVADIHKGRQVMAPPSEPAGRAQPGRAFQA